MTKNQIIELLFTGKNFNDCLSKMEPEHLREDLRQEVILIICELPEEKVIGLYERKELEFFTVRVILNTIKSKTSPFAKKYRCYLMEEYVESNNFLSSGLYGKAIRHNQNNNAATIANEAIINEERELREMVEDMAIEEVDKLYWYNKGLIELYMKYSNYRAIQKVTRIPFGSAYKTIQKSFEEIRNKIKV